MGYNSTLRGHLDFSGYLDDAVVAELNDYNNDFNNLAYGGYFTNTGWIDDGDSSKFYYLEQEARLLIERLRSLDMTVSGTVVVEGEENSDIWRLIFKDGKVVRENAKVTWPDGTEYRR